MSNHRRHTEQQRARRYAEENGVSYTAALRAIRDQPPPPTRTVARTVFPSPARLALTEAIAWCHRLQNREPATLGLRTPDVVIDPLLVGAEPVPGSAVVLSSYDIGEDSGSTLVFTVEVPVTVDVTGMVPADLRARLEDLGLRLDFDDGDLLGVVLLARDAIAEVQVLVDGDYAHSPDGHLRWADDPDMDTEGA